jgi:predicted dehydrogenase
MKENHMEKAGITRQEFLKRTALAGAAMLMTSIEVWALSTADKKIKVAVIGCGSVSNSYLPQLMSSKMIDVVSLCDIKYERAVAQNEQFKVGAKTYRNIDEVLAGVPFDMLVTLTDMQVHEELNRKALLAGKHVWSEKPLANSYKAGKALLDLANSKNLLLWGAPAVVNSPQFAYMNKALREGKLGMVSSAHGQYGHTGPHWSAFFYEKGGGTMPDLGGTTCPPSPDFWVRPVA